MQKYFYIFIFLFIGAKTAVAQCTSTINTFPYIQDFELTDGGWVSGGVLSDWAWGTPSKPVINSAGSGTKCWIAGTLNTSAYNLGERSYITTPCFDFTNVPYPFVAFKVFWETEKQYDGATFQYSTNAGTTWTNVGAFGDAVNCLNNNWFNSGNISSLNTLAPAGLRHGWAGNIQATVGACLGGDGLGSWVIAKHCMSNLAGNPSVMFRFAFGAGTNCNAYDGFAIDSFTIANAPSTPSTITATCGANNAYSFSVTNALCFTNYAWNFNDPTSANNTATGTNVSHIFSGPGNYNVRVIASGLCNKPDTSFQNIYIPNINITSSNTCTANSGTASATITNATVGATFSYSWNSTPIQSTATANNLPNGTYTVTVTQANGCTNTATVLITQAPALVANASVNNILCNGGGATINTSATGGTPGYTYLINNNPVSNPYVGGTYIVQAIDANGCTNTTTVLVSLPTPLVVNFTASNILCNGGSFVITPSATGGLPPYTFLINNVAVSSNYLAGNYTVQVTDANGCSSTSALLITQPPALVVNAIASNYICGATSVNITPSATGGTPGYTFLINTNPVSNPYFGGTYTVQASDANACTNTKTITILIPQPITFQSTVVSTFCNGQGSGSISVVPNGGVAPYTYSWNPNIGSTGSISGLNAGTYTLLVTDANACTSSVAVVLDAPIPISINVSSSQADCGKTNGSASAVVVGGVPPYNYLWSSGAIGINLNNVLAGNYTCTVTDANNCSRSTTVTIMQNNNFSASVLIKNDTCYTSTGAVNLQNATGTSPYTFTINGVPNALNNNLAEGTYTVIVNDSKGCSFSTVASISNSNIYTKPNLGANILFCTTPVLLDAGVFKNYLWSNGTTDRYLNINATGTYYVKVTNNYGCTDGDTILVTDNCSKSLFFPNAFTINGDGINESFGGITGTPQLLENYSLQIYNRWGENIFNSDSYNYKWFGIFKGLDLPIGTYFYICKYKFAGKETEIQKGDIMLLR